MVASNPVIASRATQAPDVPEGWTALWDSEEQDWYYYNPRSRTAQWGSPTAKATSVRRCGFRRILPACFFPALPSPSRGKAAALPSTATLQAIDKVDRDFNDLEIAMVLQHEEFSQDLSGRQHTFDQHWVDPAQFNYEAGPSTRAAAPQARTQPSENPFAEMQRKQHDLPAVCKQRECGICMDDDDGNAQWTWLQCTHQFHTSCVESWLKTAKRCPICRTECA